MFSRRSGAEYSDSGRSVASEARNLEVSRCFRGLAVPSIAILDAQWRLLCRFGEPLALPWEAVGLPWAPLGQPVEAAGTISRSFWGVQEEEHRFEAIFDAPGCEKARKVEMENHHFP